MGVETADLARFVLVGSCVAAHMARFRIEVLAARSLDLVQRTGAWLTPDP